MKSNGILIGIACLCFLLGTTLAEEQPKCGKNQEPYAGRCVSQYMSDYIACVESSGGNHEEISMEVSKAQGKKASGSVSGSGSGAVFQGSGSVALSLASEEALQKKFVEKWHSNAMETCIKALKSGQSKPAPKPTSMPPQVINQAPGSAVSFGQQGGLTVGQITVGSVARHLTEEDRKNLMEKVQGLNSELDFYFFVSASDSYAYADQLRAAFHDAGIKVGQTIIAMAPGPGPTFYGVELDYYGQETTDATALVPKTSDLGIAIGALVAGGVQIKQIHPSPKETEGHIRVVVGSNPAERPN